LGSEIANLLVVGGVDLEGHKWLGSQVAEYVTVHAPAKDVEVASAMAQGGMYRTLNSTFMGKSLQISRGFLVPV
jgi:hypothetical protein